MRKLAANLRCIYLNSRPMVAGMRSSLAALGIDVEDELERRRLILSWEPVAVGGNFDAGAMLSRLEEDLDEALRDGHQGLWATGDMTWEFGHASNFSKLLAYEYGLEKLMNRRPQLSGICQYRRDTLPPDVPDKALRTHRTVFINATLSYVNSRYVPRT
jgi:hypothetical protein